MVKETHDRSLFGGRFAVGCFLSGNGSDLVESFFDRLAELVLNKNTFSFRDEVFSQMSGVAMGTKMGPSYACLFMGHLEHTLLQ